MLLWLLMSIHTSHDRHDVYTTIPMKCIYNALGILYSQKALLLFADHYCFFIQMFQSMENKSNEWKSGREWNAGLRNAWFVCHHFMYRAQCANLYFHLIKMNKMHFSVCTNNPNVKCKNANRHLKRIKNNKFASPVLSGSIRDSWILQTYTYVCLRLQTFLAAVMKNKSHTQKA